jgi:predicted Rossmann fold nucleotide-binding protein DprA/Smf involved in DNA uptake
MQNWHQIRNGLTLTGVGRQSLLDLPMTAFFASRQCPGSAIRATMEWALQQARVKNVVISGFHSPLEQSVLKVLMQAHSSVVLVLARPVTSAKLTSECLAAISESNMAIVSVCVKMQRLTSALATQRNELAAAFASHIIVGYKDPNGELARQCTVWISDKEIHFL